MKTGSKKTLKSLKEEAEECFEREDYSLSLGVCNQIKKEYPKNVYGYLGTIKSVTKNYKSYVSENELKELKEDYDKVVELAKKEDKEKIEKEYNEYLEDCSEVQNLKKVKKELVSKYFLTSLYEDSIAFINQNINTVNSYNLNGKKIVNGYDLIKGLFLLVCLIFNLININYLLFLTIPFGIYGVIIIYSFLSANLFGTDKLKSEKDHAKKIIDEAMEKIESIKEDIEKNNETINFLLEQKSNTILKIPESFSEDIKDITNQNESEIAKDILNELSNNNISGFTYLIDENTNLSVDDVLLKIRPQVKEDGNLTNFINNKSTEKKNSQNEFILMRKIKPYNYFIILIFLIISILSIIVIKNNFYELNFISFVFASITGVISTIIYNINTGKHSALIDTFNDNLTSCVFNATLVYDLIYMSITNELKLTYGFIEIPIIFILIFMGFVSVISLLKYKNLMKRLKRE